MARPKSKGLLMDARAAMIEVLSAELDLDSTPEFAEAVDVILMKLYLAGFVLTPIKDEEEYV